MLLAKTESSCTTCIGNIEYAPMENENYKTMFLNICKKGKSNEMLKYSLKSIRKGQKKQWLKICYIQKIVDLIKINMSWIKAAISCAFKHW